MAPKHNRRLFTVAAALASTLYFLNMALTPSLVGENKLEEFCRPRGTTKFENVLWRNSSPASGRRYGMVDDLLTTRRLIGLKEREVTVLLGEPNSIDEADGDKLLVYHLARQRDQPARSILFPGFFPNHEVWMLGISLREGKAHRAKVFFN
jgi:hypothetical protein